jgi:hypothetical protein
MLKGMSNAGDVSRNNPCRYGWATNPVDIRYVVTELERVQRLYDADVWVNDINN